MKVAEYPQRKCREALDASGFIVYLCDIPEWHAGPCASLSNAESIKRRDAWEKANPNAKPQDPGDTLV